MNRQLDKETLDTLVADGAPFTDVTDPARWSWSYYQIMEASFDHYHK